MIYWCLNPNTDHITCLYPRTPISQHPSIRAISSLVCKYILPNTVVCASVRLWFWKPVELNAPTLPTGQVHVMAHASAYCNPHHYTPAHFQTCPLIITYWAYCFRYNKLLIIENSAHGYLGVDILVTMNNNTFADYFNIHFVLLWPFPSLHISS